MSLMSLLESSKHSVILRVIMRRQSEQLVYIQVTIVNAERLAVSFHAVMHHQRLCVIGNIFGQLPHIGCSRQIEDNMLGEERKLLVEGIKRVWLHRMKVEYFI